MVLVDGVKYACQACIKGHRSSKCTHTNRELTEIKKKGRPTSQCNHCRQLRKTRSVHGKCECVAGQADREQTPAAKVLPNGLIDIMTPMIPSTSSSSATETLKSGVTLLLNPCNCKNGGDCTCCQVVSKAKSKPFPNSPHTASSPIFASPSLPSPPSPSSLPVTEKLSSCCSSSKPSTSQFQSVSQPQPQPHIRSNSSYCGPSTSQTLRVASTSTCCSTTTSNSSFPSPSLQSSTSLFLPATHGTSSCFCGPTCQCVGCATHDPFGLKVKRKRSDSIEEGVPVQEVMGCQCEVGSSKESEKREGKKKKRECCEPKSVVERGERGGIEWPELRWDGVGERNRSLSSGIEGGGGAGESLPSLRTLLPALIDSTSQAPSSTFDIPVLDESTYFSPPQDLPLYPPASHIFYSPTSHPPPADPSTVKIACSSAYLAPELYEQEENKGHDGDCGDFCACDDLCGCKATEMEKDEGQNGLEEVARMAEMGYFG